MHFGFAFTRDALAREPGVAVVQCERSDLAAALADADVAVPLMSALDAGLLARAPRLKLIIQYGVGVEAVDAAAATAAGVWLSNIPSHGTGNAISCAEHALFLMLACLRHHNAMADRCGRQAGGGRPGRLLRAWSGRPRSSVNAAAPAAHSPQYPGAAAGRATGADAVWQDCADHWFWQHCKGAGRAVRRPAAAATSCCCSCFCCSSCRLLLPVPLHASAPR